MKLTLLWLCAIAAAAFLLVAADYRSRDPDSSLYARLAADLAGQPMERWIAPEWRGAWDHQGLFREHPAGILWPPALLIKSGFPAGQAPYVVNMAYQAAAILLIPLVAGAVVRPFEARALAWILQLIPLAFVYRIRANQEHPLLMCFLALLYATHRARTHAAWLLLMVASFCALVLLKGAFAMFALVAAAIWALLIPASDGGSNRWAWVGLATAAGSAALMTAGYEALYARATGESFLDFYRSLRLGASISLTEARVVPHSLVNVAWYMLRLLWFAAPWSLIACVTAWFWLRARARGTREAEFADGTDRAMAWSLVVVAVFIAVLSPALVRAERFIFPAYFIVGAIGAVSAIRWSPWMRDAAIAADRYRPLPVLVWFATFLLSLGSRVVR